MSVAIQSKREELSRAFQGVIIIQQLVSLGHDTVIEITLDKHTVSIPSTPRLSNTFTELKPTKPIVIIILEVSQKRLPFLCPKEAQRYEIVRPSRHLKLKSNP